MKPGQRINLLKKLAKRLAEFTYSEGDLILRQFSIPWTDQWSGGGDNHSYFLAMVERGDDEHLVSLHNYFFPDDPLPGLVVSESITSWKPSHLRLFISHSSKRALQVGQIKTELLAFGVDAFVAHDDIEPTTEWLIEIRKALGSCHALVAVLCDDFKSSNYCDQEVGFGLQRGIPIIPVIVNLNPYGFMGPLQGFAATDLSPSIIASAIRKLLFNHATTKDIAEIAEQVSLEKLVNDFLNSSNYGISTTLLQRLEGYDSLPRPIVNKVAMDWKKNDQITGCMGIPRRMELFLKRHTEPLKEK
jgi:hypothetical protein